jgi:hypothetical protein
MESDTFQFEGNLVQIFSSRAGIEGKASFQLKLPDIIIYVVCADKEALKAFIAAADRLNKDPDFGKLSLRITMYYGFELTRMYRPSRGARRV